MFKKFLIALIIFIIGVILVFVYFEHSKQKEIDTSNWETYTNEEMGFSIKYPDDFSDIKNKFFNKISFFHKNNSCTILEDINEQMICSIKNSISIEKTEKNFIDFKNDLNKDNTIKNYYRGTINLKDDLIGEKFFLEGKEGYQWFNLDCIFISTKNGNFIIQGSELEKIQLGMVSTFRLID